MIRRLSTTIAVTHFYCAVIYAEIGVSSANVLGESAPTMNGEPPAVLLPSTPFSLDVELIGNDKARLTWAGELDSGNFDRYLLFSAKDDEPWTLRDVGSQTTFDDTIEPDHLYRYKVSVYGLRISEFSTFVSSLPSNEKVVGRATATMVIGSNSDQLLFGPSTTGSFTLEGFVPGVNPPNPPTPSFFFAGSFSLERANGWGGLEQYGEIDGVLPVGVSLSATGYVDPNHSMPSPSVRVDTEWSHAATDFPVYLQPLPDNPDEMKKVLDGSGSFALHLAKFSGDANFGFDDVSNPKWQMLPRGGEREVTAEVLPGLWGPLVNSIPFFNEELGLFYSLAPGVPPIEISSVEVAGDYRIQAPKIRATLGVDVRQQQVITVGVFRVRYNSPHPTIPNLIVYDEIPSVSIEQEIEAGLNAIYGPKANIRFDVTIEPSVVEFSRAEELTVDGAVDINTEAARFEAITSTNGYRICIFVFRFYRFKSGPIRIGRLGGVANSIPGNFAFVGTKDLVSWGHEIGHLLGLSHSFLGGYDLGTSRIPDNSRERLMGYDRTAFRLIKRERDLIHMNAPHPTSSP